MKIQTFYTAVLLSAGLTGCMTYDPYTSEKEVSKSTAGAAIGASVGAIGAAIANRDDDPRDRNQRVLAAAAVGGALGGGAGYYMDRQEAKLRAELQNTGVSVTRDGNNVILVIPSNNTFATGSSTLNPGFESVLSSVSMVLKEYDKTLLEITGHTDSVGSDSSNMILSDSRARSVSNSLQRNGVSLNRMLTQGFGEGRPIASNNTEMGRQANRRVELVLIPIA